MSEIIWAALALAALLLTYPAMIAHDVRRHPEPRFQVPAPDLGAMTAGGVPYVAGRN